MRVAIDTETRPIGPGQVLPDLVLMSYATSEGQSGVVTTADRNPHTIPEVILSWLQDPETELVFHNAAFDLGVLFRAYPELTQPIFDRLQPAMSLGGQSGVYCTRLNEKLIQLGDQGSVTFMHLPDGSAQPIKYSLADLGRRYLGSDRQAAKEAELRTSYEMFLGMTADELPQEAVDYAVDDAKETLDVFEAQGGPRATLEFQTASDFSLILITAVGMRVDRDTHNQISEAVERYLDLENWPELTAPLPSQVQKIQDDLTDQWWREQGGVCPVPMSFDDLMQDGDFCTAYLARLAAGATSLVSPPQPEMPYANGAIDKATGEPKMRKARPEKTNQKVIQALVEEVCAEHDIEVEYTETGRVSTSTKWLQDLAPYSPALSQYVGWQEYRKLHTTDLPRLDADLVHVPFDCLKETGRTSSSQSKLYPSLNGQNVYPPARRCIVPRDGHLICSIDYSSLELCTFAQTTYDLFGYSTHRDKINSGEDLHGYLAANLYRRFRAEGDPDWETAKQDPSTFKHWRKFAKPVGLGFPGGLGPDTLVTLAHSTYGVTMTPDDARTSKEVWLETYPEAAEWFEYVNTELLHSRHKTSEGFETRFTYTTPRGMVRGPHSYTACANGRALQSPGAEGAKTAVFEVVREICTTDLGEICYPINFIHDEILFEVREDAANQAIPRLKEIMEQAMRVICPDVLIRTEAALMDRWDKRADQILDDDGNVVVWTPPAGEVWGLPFLDETKSNTEAA